MAKRYEYHFYMYVVAEDYKNGLCRLRSARGKFSNKRQGRFTVTPLTIDGTLSITPEGLTFTPNENLIDWEAAEELEKEME